MGLAACAAVNLWLDVPDPLPGVALGAAPVLVVERTAVLFLAWVLVLLILVESFNGRLPLEISGRGVRYADAETTGEAARTTDVGIARLELELAGYRREQQDIRRLLRGFVERDRI